MMYHWYQYINVYTEAKKNHMFQQEKVYIVVKGLIKLFMWICVVSPLYSFPPNDIVLYICRYIF